jgi:hypothetical protein
VKTRSLLSLLLLALQLPAEDLRGLVQFAGQPLPGATVKAQRGTQLIVSRSQEDGSFRLEGLSPGEWKIEISKQLFAAQTRMLTIPAAATLEAWNIELLPVDQLQTLSQAAPKVVVPPPPPPVAVPQKPARPEPAAELAADSLMINGSANNGAASAFAGFPAFGNNRRGPGSRYNGNFGLIANHSALDARNYSLTGQNTPKAQYSRFEGLFSFGGPIMIPKLLRRNGPNFVLNYQWTRNRNATVESALMPTEAERAGNLASRPNVQFPNNQIPASLLSPSAQKLLELYPLPNFNSGSGFNYQMPLRRALHQDDLQFRISKQAARRDNVQGNFAWQSIRTDTPTVFQFLDTSKSQGFNAGAQWRHSFKPRFFINNGIQYSSLSRNLNPFFAGRRNIAAEAGITVGDQSPEYWGPPSLSFSSGIAGLRDAQYSRTRNQTVAVNSDAFYNIGRHYLQFGVTHRQQQFNSINQQDPRGSFAFTGQAAGDDLAGFLLGVADTSTISFGNADKYLRASGTDVFFNDDYRVNPGLTLNMGLRYEYSSPASEKFGRLSNLALSNNFATATQALNLLPRPDRNNFAPRFGFSWRPFPASSMVVRGGYGIYYDTGIYSAIAFDMAQQAPFSRNIRAAGPLPIAGGFAGQASTNTYAVDPGFRVGYAQNWQLSVQRDLPFALQMTATYNGSKGTRARQQILPNTFPLGGENLCAACPSNFNYQMSNGNMRRNAGLIQLRRRLRAGFSGELSYTWAKAIDDAVVAQNWQDLRAEKARSNFDQRHLLTLQGQYTTGIRKSKVFRDWTIGTSLNAGSGLPLTPVFFAPLSGSGVTGTLRPDFTGQPLYIDGQVRSLNPSAVARPQAGRWGNAGRNSINGPSQFAMNASLARTFRGTDKVSLDLRVDAANVLNTATFPSWNTVAGNQQFGLPNTANPMRVIQTTFRARF